MSEHQLQQQCQQVLGLSFVVTFDIAKQALKSSKGDTALALNIILDLAQKAEEEKEKIIPVPLPLPLPPPPVVIERELSVESGKKMQLYDKRFGREHEAANALLLAIATCIKSGDIDAQTGKLLKNLIASGDLNAVRRQLPPNMVFTAPMPRELSVDSAEKLADYDRLNQGRRHGDAIEFLEVLRDAVSEGVVNKAHSNALKADLVREGNVLGDTRQQLDECILAKKHRAAMIPILRWEQYQTLLAKCQQFLSPPVRADAPASGGSSGGTAVSKIKINLPNASHTVLYMRPTESTQALVDTITMLLLQPWAAAYAADTAKSTQRHELQEQEPLSTREVLGLSFEAWVRYPVAMVALVGRTQAGVCLEDFLAGPTLAHDKVKLEAGGNIDLKEIIMV